jgi:hypothetical protein
MAFAFSFSFRVGCAFVAFSASSFRTWVRQTASSLMAGLAWRVGKDGWLARNRMETSACLVVVFLLR